MTGLASQGSFENAFDALTIPGLCLKVLANT
jgi:hypothetical protein